MFRILALVLLLSPVTFAQRLPDLTVPDALGVNIHFTTPKPGEMRMLADAGFKWVRMDFTWAATEREKGVYDFSRYDALLQFLAPHNIRPLFILDYANRLYDDGLPPHTDVARAAMARWAAAAAIHFKGKGVVWEMWNEPNIAQFWKPKPNADDYTQLALAVAKALRAADPAALHVGPATSTIDLPFLETCFKAGLLEHWDAVSVHPYRQGHPETANPEYRNLRLLIARYAPKGKTIPILSGEWGYSAAWKNFDEARQAKYLPRQLLTNLYNEIPISIWYDWHDDGPDPKEPEHHFGTVRHPYKKGQSPAYDPKPAYLAMKTLTEQLGGYTYNKRLALADEQDYLLVFTKEDDVRLAAWTTSKTPRRITLPASPGKFTITNHIGDETTAAVADGSGLDTVLSDTVQYVVPEQPNDLLRIAAAWRRAPLEVVVHAPGTAKVHWSLVNPLLVPVNVSIGESKPRRVMPGNAASELWIRAVRRGDYGRTLSCSLTLAAQSPLTQHTRLIASNPIHVMLMPPARELLPVQITNPSGDPFNGELTVFGSVNAIANPIVLDSGERQRVFLIKLNQTKQGDTTIGATLGDKADRSIVSSHGGATEIIRIDNVRFTPAVPFPQTPSPNVDSIVRVIPDGDGKVTSSQAISIAEPPPGLPEDKATTCFKLTYSFSPGWKFLQLKPATDDLKKIDGHPKELALWLHGDASNHRVRLRYTDATGQTFQPSGPRIDWKGWRYITIPLAGPDLAHWGGKNDGEVHHPIVWDTLFLLDNESREKSAGEVWIASPTLIE